MLFFSLIIYFPDVIVFVLFSLRLILWGHFSDVFNMSGYFVSFVSGGFWGVGVLGFFM